MKIFSFAFLVGLSVTDHLSIPVLAVVDAELQSSSVLEGDNAVASAIPISTDQDSVVLDNKSEVPPTTVSSGVHVTENFLSEEQVEHFIQVARKELLTMQDPNYKQESPFYHRSNTEVDPELYQHITAKMLALIHQEATNQEQVCHAEEVGGNNTKNKHFQLQITSVLQTTKPHSDMVEDPNVNAFNPETTTGFIFLEDTDQAYFQHGAAETVPAKRGSLVVFPGGYTHHSFVKPNSMLHLLGPFAVTSSGGLTSVKNHLTPQPSLSPSVVPSITPSMSPSFNVCSPNAYVGTCKNTGEVLMYHSFFGILCKQMCLTDVAKKQAQGWACGNCPAKSGLVF